MSKQDKYRKPRQEPMICPICRGPLGDVKNINHGLLAKLCRKCDFLVTVTDTDPKIVNAESYPLKERILTYYFREKEFISRYGSMLRLMRLHARIDSLLEVGSNIGVFANFARHQGIRVDSVELNLQCREFQRLMYKIDVVEALSGLPRKTYDAIVLMDVLEHIPEPVEYLTGLLPYLRKKDGILFLQFPNKNCWIARMAGDNWGWWAAPDHLYHFSDRAVRCAAEKAGFKICWLRCASPVLDDLSAIPVIGGIARPFHILSRWWNVNPITKFRGGSLIQAVLKPMERSR